MKIDFNELRELVSSAGVRATLNKLDELEHDMIKEILLDNNHRRATEGILEDVMFQELRTLIATYDNSYYVHKFTDIVLDYSYGLVNSILLELLDEKLKEETNEEDSNNE